MTTLNGKLILEYQSRFGEKPAGQASETEQRWQQICQELMEERDRLHGELKRSQEECQQYRTTILQMLPLDEEAKKFAELTFEEAMALKDKNGSFEDLVAEVKLSLGQKNG